MRVHGILFLLAPLNLVAADKATFFESRIRPVLAESCYECHNSSGKKKGGLALDFRNGLIKGGESGSALADGLLLKAIRHEADDLKMPKAGPKLAPEVIADFEKWIADGAFDPRDEPPSEADLAAETSWETIRERRKEWWSFQPVRRPPGDGLSIDALLQATLDEQGLKARGRADKATVYRRLKFVLTGLPPEPEEVRAFAGDDAPDALRRAAERLLASPAFGERWARHWMDWLRYADSHGSEGDPAIPHAWRYRDYLIRALNADVPYDQLVREHLAGDLLKNPRVGEDGRLNESAIGPAHLRMVFHGFAPTDALDELVRFTDDEIDVVTKAFMGLTVSCARCHNHKFDAISQADYYALFGVFASCRPALIDARHGEDAVLEEMRATKEAIRRNLAAQWQRGLPPRLESDPFGLLERLRAATDIAAQWEKERAGLPEATDYDFSGWRGIGAQPSPAGEFAIHASGPKLLSGIFPRGIYSHALSTKQNANIGSERMRLDGHQRLFVRIAGDGQSIARYVVQNYPRNGTVYPVANLKGGNWIWQQWDLAYWDGDDIHFELTTAADSAVLAKPEALRSWFGVRDVRLVPDGEPAPRDMPNEALAAVLAKPAPSSAAEAESLLAEALREAVSAWKKNAASDAQALFLDGCVSAGILPNEAAALGELAQNYRELEAALPEPVRVPGVVEGEIFDQPLFDRGNHKQPLEPVSRRFLEAFGARTYPADESGRRQLADDILRSPLAARVIVNRLWHHVFGLGLVPTADNFGKLGDLPSHPELLDFLSDEMARRGWALKSMLLDMVTSEAFQRESGGTEEEEKWLASWRSRRLEAEAIRDAILAVSGKLDRAAGGGPGADGGSARRSVYVRVIRNALDPFLTAFDAPEPLSTRGRRDSTNVPAQSLALMNDPFVAGAAAAWVRSLPEGSDEAKARQLLLQAFGREPEAREVAAAVAYLADNRALSEQLKNEKRAREQKLDALRSEVAALERPAREALAADAPEAAPPDLKPLAAWEFDDGLRDSVGGLHVTAHGARIENGALVLDGSGYAETGTLPKPLAEKTLEALVQLDGLDQRGGGAMTVQKGGGALFDSIVYGEKDPRQWLAGSNFFDRTQAFGGAAEAEAAQQPVHVVIAYDKDGTVRCYRDGEPYGRSYKSNGPAKFGAKGSNVLFGLRHSPPVDGRFLKGRIHRAALYDRALTEDEIRAASGQQGVVTEAQVLAALTDADRARRAALLAEIASLSEAGDAGVETATDPWEDLALAIFNMKEFIYLR